MSFDKASSTVRLLNAALYECVDIEIESESQPDLGHFLILFK